MPHNKSRGTQSGQAGCLGALGLMLAIVAAYAVYSDPGGLVLNKQAEPVDAWYRFKLSMIGRRFYDSQLAAYKRSATLQREVWEDEDRMIQRLESARAVASDIQNPRFSKAEALEAEAQLKRAEERRTFSRDFELSIFEKKEATIAAIQQKIEERGAESR